MNRIDSHEQSYLAYQKLKEKQLEELDKLSKELKRTANIFFSSEDGRKFGRQLLKAVHYLQPLPSNISDNDLRYIQAQRDFVDTFVVGLISNETLIKLIKD